MPLLSGVFVQTFGLVKLALNITTGHMRFCRLLTTFVLAYMSRDALECYHLIPSTDD